MKSGGLDIGFVTGDAVPQLNGLWKSLDRFGYPPFGFNSIVFNFKDTTGGLDKIIAQQYVREALAHLVDQDGYLRACTTAPRRRTALLRGPPPSPYTPDNALTNPYPFSIQTASQLLTSHGWNVKPNGTTTCTSPGTGPQFGEGIPAGAAIHIRAVFKE